MVADGEVDVGERTTVSGHIQEAHYVADEIDDALRAHNDRVLAELPERFHRSDGPGVHWLTRDMVRVSTDFVPFAEQRWPHYRGRVITFAATYKSIWDVWPEWLATFEDLLATLYWENAAVVQVNEWMPDATCTWRADPIRPTEDGGLPAPPAIAAFTGPRSLDDLAPEA